METKWTISQEAAMTLDGKSLLVSAAAGSGKTSVLTERIIRRLTDEEHPADISRMLIVTFTRAAAAELKAKIAKALTKALAENPSNKRLADQLLLLGSADISTIDSFFQKIVRENFEQLGVPANFRIADASELLPICFEVMESVTELFYDNYKNTDDGLHPYQAIRNNPFADMMDNLMSNRSDGKIIPLLLNYYDQFSSYPEGIELLKSCSEKLSEQADSDFLQSDYGSSLNERLRSTFEAFQNELVAIKSSLAYDPDVAYKCESLIESDISFCRAICDALDTKQYQAVQAVVNSFLSMARFPTIKNKPKEAEYYKNWRAIFKDEIKKMQGLLQYPESVVQEQMHRTADFAMMLYRLYREYQGQIYSEKLSRGILEHNDVRALLYRLLTDESGQASAFADSLSSRYEAVYIDEYQDVDFLQDKIFEIIGRDRRFMVGDIKQSIYGFRGSEPSIFAAYRKEMPLYTDQNAEDASGNCVFMSDNFRCNRSVIEFANSVCAFLFSACEKSVGYRPQDDLVCSKPNQNESNASPVHVAVFDKSSHTEGNGETESSDEAVWTASEIARLISEEHLDNGSSIKPSDIAILVRNKAHGKAFAKELRKKGIPVSAEASENILYDPLLINILNFLRVIDNPYRDIPLSEFLISEFGGFTLEELTEVRSFSSDSKTLFDAMQDAVAEHFENHALCKKLNALLERIDSFRRHSQILPADRFLRLLFLDKLFSKYSTEPSLLYLYDQARLYQRTSWCGLYGFLKHIDKLIESGQNNAGGFEKAESAVSIMTVHHSKGLEFPVVFLCSCGSSFNRSDVYESFMFHKSIGCAVKLYNAETAGSETTILRETIAEQINEDLTEEAIRTLYVALTRARERLYITGTLSGQWENALASAQLIHRGDRNAILGCNSYLSWIIASLLEDGNMPSACVLAHITHDEIASLPNPQTIEAEIITNSPVANAENTSVLSYAGILLQHESFSYDLSALEGLPTKIAASKIAPDLLDRLEDEQGIEQAIELMKNTSQSFSSVLTSKSNVHASDVGIATHAFLQYCDYHALLKNGIDAECTRLVANGFMDEATISIIHRKQLEGFLNSCLMEQILNAKRVWREQKFGIEIPLSELTLSRQKEEILSKHSMFVQGSIDLLIQTADDKILLIDYKTDKIDDEIRDNESALVKKMMTAHGNQLACYRRAVCQLLGKNPDKTHIYSLPLGRMIEIPFE